MQAAIKTVKLKFVQKSISGYLENKWNTEQHYQTSTLQSDDLFLTWCYYYLWSSASSCFGAAVKIDTLLMRVYFTWSYSQQKAAN